MKNKLISKEEVIELIEEYNPTASFEIEYKEIDGVKYYIIKSIHGLYISSKITENCSVAYYKHDEYIYFSIFLKREI